MPRESPTLAECGEIIRGLYGDMRNLTKAIRHQLKTIEILTEALAQERALREKMRMQSLN